MNHLEQRHKIVISNPKPPVIEFDAECGAVYVRFSSKTVAKTIERTSDGMIVTLDMDKSGAVVGVEGIGFDELSIFELLKAANVKTERIDFSKSPIRSTSRQVNRDLAAA